MSGSFKSILVSTLFCILLIVIVAYLNYKLGISDGMMQSDKVHNRAMDSLTKKNDSLSMVISELHQSNRGLYLTIGMLNRQKDSLKELVRAEDSTLLVFRRKYKQLHWINAFNSDSIIRYFKNNFDSSLNQ